jgi:hypothetical protein
VPKPFDISSKMTWEEYPEDYAEWLGPGGSPAIVIDADLATVSGAADKVIRVGRGRNRWLLMVEFLASYKSHVPERTQWHSTLLAHRHRLPVRSVIVLMRPAADGPAMNGMYERACPGEKPYLTFRYRVVRLWQVPAADMLSGGPGLLPMAPVSAVQPDELPEVLHRVKHRIDREVPEDRAADLLAATYVLMGLRYDASMISALKREVLNMEESITFQEIKGLGRLEEIRKSILLLGKDKFGKESRRAARKLDTITDLIRLEALLTRVLHVNSWEELLSGR